MIRTRALRGLDDWNSRVADNKKIISPQSIMAPMLAIEAHGLQDLSWAAAVSAGARPAGCHRGRVDPAVAPGERSPCSAGTGGQDHPDRLSHADHAQRRAVASATTCATAGDPRRRPGRR
jgi:hypothetical protein